MATNRLKLEDIDLSHIYEYVNHGEIQNAPEEIVRYLDLLDKARSMSNKLGESGSKDAVVGHLIKVEGLSRYLATNIYNDSMEYFYSSKAISRDAYRHFIAELKHKNYLLAMELSKDTKDVASADKILDSMAKVLGLDMPDPIEVPASAYTQPFKMYSIDAEFLGLPKINRTKIKELLSELPEISERLRLRLEEEAGLLPTVKLFLDEHEDPRQS